MPRNNKPSPSIKELEEQLARHRVNRASCLPTQQFLFDELIQQIEKQLEIVKLRGSADDTDRRK